MEINSKMSRNPFNGKNHFWKQYSMSFINSNLSLNIFGKYLTINDNLEHKIEEMSIDNENYLNALRQQNSKLISSSHLSPHIIHSNLFHETLILFLFIYFLNFLAFLSFASFFLYVFILTVVKSGVYRCPSLLGNTK